MNKNVCLVTTMPKSGTWYCKYFFHYYHQVLTNTVVENSELDRDERSLVRKYSDSMGITDFTVVHSLPPNIDKLSFELKSRWEQLTFYVHGYNYGHELLWQDEHFAKALNEEQFKQIYLYRNPLDHAVSFYHHIVKHKDERHRKYTDNNGNEHPITSPANYFLNVGAEAYIKQFYPYLQMVKQGDENIQLVSYEDLFQYPEQTFKLILKHFGHDVDALGHQKAFELALQLCSLDSMKSFENKLGKALGSDQLDDKERHVRDGKIGKWREYFTDEDVDIIENKFNAFNLSLNDFQLTL